MGSMRPERLLLRSAGLLVIRVSGNMERNMGYENGYGASQHHEKDVWRFAFFEDMIPH
jgi:hypothetical protein